MAVSKDEETLGNKHKIYNKLLHDVIASKKPLDALDFSSDTRDLNNLMKIDIASHNRDIDYILSVLKCIDMLYVTRALKKSTWLMEDQYAHIINPKYLRDNIFPHMTVKAIIKLVKHIRQHLKGESRVEDFYKSEEKSKAAAKWLLHCSIPFIEAHINKHITHMNNLEFKRLCEKSVSIFEVSMKENACRQKLTAALFLLNKHVDKYLDIVEQTHRYSRPNFGPKATALIMKQNPKRIFDKICMYIQYIHVATFVKFLKSDEINSIMHKLANKYNEGKNEQHNYRTIFDYNVIKHFVARMPKEEQLDFVKKVFLDVDNLRKIEDDLIEPGSELYARKRMSLMLWSSTPPYYWYQFAPFDTAFVEIKKLLQGEDNIYEKYSKLKVLVKCAGSNAKYLQRVLLYFNKITLNDEGHNKTDFVNTVISESKIFNYDEQTWNEFNQTLINMEIYNEQNDNFQYTPIIFINHILRNQEIPKVIERTISLSTLKNYRRRLSQDKQNQVLDYVYNYVTNKIHNHNIDTEIEFGEAIELLDQFMDLLIHWDKKPSHYPLIMDKIKDFITIRKNNGWNTKLTPLYNQKKSWRKHLFEESVILNPSQSVCMNALKHDPGLLIRHRSDVEKICCDDTVSLKQLHNKIRIYWPESLAKDWVKYYLSRLDKLGGHRALTQGICTLLPIDQLLGIIQTYAPKQPKIDWNIIDELTLGLQRCFAKIIHIARPQPPPDAILMYAKGDYLQYALPSVHAIYYNLSCVQSQQEIPKLLNAPVSLQKHGLRFAFIKLTHEDLKHHLSSIWKTTKNISIRSVTFELLFDLLCKEKDAVKAEELWEILELFMDNLSFQEDKKIYDKLSKVSQMPENVKPKFLMKSYKFLKNLLPHLKMNRGNYERSIDELATYTREVMEHICPEFVADIIKEYLEQKLCNKGELNSDMICVISSYVLCAKDADAQTQRYEKILKPLILRSLSLWNVTHDGDYYMRRPIIHLLTGLSVDLDKYVIRNKMIIPTKLFTEIQNKLNGALDITENYVMLTAWKVVVKLTEMIENSEKREQWDEICEQLASEIGKYCLEVLKQDVKSYFPCIYMLFSKVFENHVRDILPASVILDIYEIMLTDEKFIPAYLMVLKNFDSKCSYFEQDEDPLISKPAQIRKIIREHPSVEVKMHYYNVFKNEDTEDF